MYEILSVKETRDLETGGRGYSRSLKMALLWLSFRWIDSSGWKLTI